MTTRDQLVGHIQRPGQRPESVNLTVQQRPVLTSAEKAAGIEWVDGRYDKPGDVRRYGAIGDGSTDNATAFANCALVDDGVFYVPAGSFITSASVDILSNTKVYGEGLESVVEASGTNQVSVFSITDKSDVSFRDLSLVGSDTATSTSNGTGLFFTDSDNFSVENVSFTLFGGVPLRIQGDDTGGHSRFIIKGCNFFDNELQVAGSESGEVTVSGGISNGLIADCRFVADATTPYARGVFCANNGATLNWSEIVIRNNYFDGYSNNGIGCTDENPATAFDNGVFIVDGNIIKNSTEMAVKVKNGRRNFIVNNYCLDNDATPEDAGNLQGTIQVNSGQGSVISNNQIFGAGTDAIKVFGLSTADGGTTAGAGRSAWSITGNLIEDCDEVGIYVANDVYDCTIANNVVRNASGIGIRITADSAAKANSVITVTGNVVKDPTSRGILIDYSDEVTVTGNYITNGAFGILSSNSDNLTITGNTILDSDSGTDGIRVTTADYVSITGNRSGNSAGSTQRYGVSLATVTDAIVSGNNLENNATSAMSVDQGVLISNNLGAPDNADTATNLADATATINTAGKFTGKMCWDDTNNILYRSAGTGTTSVWEPVDGGTAITPS